MYRPIYTSGFLAVKMVFFDARNFDLRHGIIKIAESAAEGE